MATCTIREVTCKTAINRVRGMPFDWGLNPYRGCRHACVYCYARPTHEFLGLDGGQQFQEIVFAKVNAPEVVRAQMQRKSWSGDNVVLGTATDPYQQAESRYRLTRGILEVFRDHRNPVSITTKSPMVLRDVDLLAELAEHVPVTVHFTVTTLDETVWKKVEPTTSKPRKRLEAIRELRNHGIRAGIFLSPVLPGITDGRGELEAVIDAGIEYGAQFVYSTVLRLGPGITEYYIPFLEREFPQHVAQYRHLYHGNYVTGEYARTIERRVAAHKRQVGLVDEQILKSAARPRRPAQLSLFVPSA